MKHSSHQETAIARRESPELNDLLIALLNDLGNTSEKSSASYESGRINEESGEVHIRDYWRSVRKHIWFIIGLVLFTTAAMAFYQMRKPDLYEAQARVQVDVDNNSNARLGDIKNNSFVFNNPVNYPAYFNTQLKIIAGPGLLRRVAKTLDLEHNPKFSNTETAQKDDRLQEKPLGDAPAAASSHIDIEEATKLAPLVEQIQKTLVVEPVIEDQLTTKNTFLIDIKYTNPDRQIAAKVVNTIAEIFVLSNLERKTQNNTATGDYLQKRIVELQTQIRNGEEQLANYSRSHQILSLDASQNTVVDRLTGLNKQLLEAENDRKLAEAAYRAAQAPGSAEALAQGADSGAAKQLGEAQEKLSGLRQQRAQLLINYTEKNPEVQQLNEQIKVVETQIKDIRSQSTQVILLNLETRYRQTLAREQALRAAFNDQRGETLTQNQAAINYRIIQQEIETNKELLNGLLQRSKENDVLLAGVPNNISVVDYATVPYKPVGQARLMAIILTFVLSLIVGIALAIFLDYLDDSLRTIDDIEGKLHLPALAAIPAMGSSRRHRIRAGNGALQLRDGKNGKYSELLINSGPRSPLAEAYRQLRTSVLLSTPGQAPKTILVTSSRPSEGKTTTSINTSICLAQTGAKVLILDADMRRPRLHTVFDLDNSSGLSAILASEATDTEIYSLIQRDERTGLYLLPAGPIPPNPAELLGSDQMRQLLETLEDSFTHIIIDSPPIISFTDGVLISRLVDGVLLVVQSGKSTIEMAQRSRKRLIDIGAKIFGVVLNSVDTHQHDYYYEYYTSSYYKASANGDEASAGA